MNDYVPTSSSALPMPDLRNTFPGPFHASPHADHIEQQALGWLDAFPLVTSLDAQRTLCNITGQGMARVFPAADRDSLVLLGRLFLWLTAFDDAHGETVAASDPAHLVRQIGEFIHVLTDNDLPDATSPFTTALHDLLTQFRTRATPTQYQRLTGHLRDNLFGILWEAHHLSDPGSVTLREYCAMRPHTVFVRTVMASADIAMGYELPEEQRSSTAVRELESAVAHLAGWINDLASYTRETAHGGREPLSLPTLLMRQHGCDVRGAFSRASGMCEDQAATARRRITDLVAAGTSPCADHARAMESVASSYVWHINHARYLPLPVLETEPPR